MKNNLIGALLAFAIPAGFVTAQEDAHMDAKQLGALAPCITLKDPSIKTFELSGVFDLSGMKMRVVLICKQPDKLAMWILDAVDGTPVMLAMGRDCMMYDPIASEVLVGEASPNLHMKVAIDPEKLDALGNPERNVEIGFSFNSAVKDEQEMEGDDLTIIDIPSFLNALVPPMDIKREGGRYLLSGKTPSGGQVILSLDPSRKQGACRRVELNSAGEKSPFLVLDGISINQPIEDERFQFPKARLAESGIPTHNMMDDGVVDKVMSIRQLMIAFMTRMVLAGVEDPQLKAAVEATSLKPIDWNQLRENDARNAPALKRVFSE